MKEIIKSIIKEYLEPYPGVIRKSNDPVGYGDNKEMLDKFYRVSRIEENEALNFIRNRFMDYAVGLFKLQFGRLLTSKSEHKELSTDIVNGQLKKISEEHYPDKRKKDVIQYSAPLIKNYNLDINIFKSEDGDLAIGYVNPIQRSIKYFLVNGPQRLTPLFEADSPKPIGGYNERGDPKWSDEELYEHFYRISKIEEDKVFAYIKRTLVPSIVHKYNTWVIEANRITPEQVNAGLRKVRQEAYPISLRSQTLHDVIVWRVDIRITDAIATFMFFTFKYFASKLFVGVRSPISGGVGTYSAFTEPPYKFDLDIRPHHDSKLFKESVEHDWHLTKIEEQKALQFIRHSIFPQVLEDYNEAAAERKVPVIHYGSEEREIIDSLRKVERRESPENKVDQILYVAEFKGWQWVFIIEKVGIGVHVPFIRAGYIDDVWNQSKMYKIDILRPDNPHQPWQDPTTSFKKITDYMPHQSGGVPGLLSLLKKRKLEESQNRANLRISKQEEQWSLQRLRNETSDTTFQKTLKKVDEKRSTNPLISDILYFFGKYSDGTEAHIKIIKNMDGDLRYIILGPKWQDQGSRPIPLKENYGQLNLHITKEEENWALQQLRKRKNSQGETIGKYLKKIEHVVSKEPNRLSDRIKYKNTDDATTYTIVKNRVDGELGYHAGYIAYKKVTPYGARERDDYESKDIDGFQVPLHEYVMPPWPKALLTKKDEARAVQFLKYLTDIHRTTLFPNLSMEKTIKKIKIIPSENPNTVSDKSVYVVTLSGEIAGKGQQEFKHQFEIYFSNRLGLMISDPINYARYHVDDGLERELKENIEHEPKLTKQDEARAFQFIRGIPYGDKKPLGKTLKKVFNQPSHSNAVSHSAYFKGKLPNGYPITFRVFKSKYVGLVVKDEVNSISYLLDKPNPYGDAITDPIANAIKNDLAENKNQIDPKFLITKKEEAQAFAWLSNQTEKGERFGKNIKKIFDDNEDGKHLIEYLVDSGSAVGIFAVLKNQAGWIIIRNNYGSVMHIIKHP